MRNYHFLKIIFLFIILAGSISAHSFEFKKLNNGLNFLGSPNTPSNQTSVIFLINGINEKGDTWKDPIENLLKNPDLVIYFYKWNKKENLKKLSRNLSISLNAIQTLHSNASEIRIFAHSAGGNLLLKSLCDPNHSKNCFFKESHPDIQFSTIASPLAGFRYKFSSAFSLIIGKITAFMGSKIEYQSIQPQIKLKVYLTDFDHDMILRKGADKDVDIRLPIIVNPKNFHYQSEMLHRSNHNDSVKNALSTIY